MLYSYIPLLNYLNQSVGLVQGILRVILREGIDLVQCPDHCMDSISHISNVSLLLFFTIEVGGDVP